MLNRSTKLIGFSNEQGALSGPARTRTRYVNEQDSRLPEVWDSLPGLLLSEHGIWKRMLSRQKQKILLAVNYLSDNLWFLIVSLELRQSQQDSSSPYGSSQCGLAKEKSRERKDGKSPTSPQLS